MELEHRLEFPHLFTIGAFEEDGGTTEGMGSEMSHRRIGIGEPLQ